MVDITTLKNDVLSELKSKKYYIQRELERIASAEMEHKSKVVEMIDLISDIGSIDNTVRLVEQIFVTEPPKSEPQQNVIEQPAPTPAPIAGQSHGE